MYYAHCSSKDCDYAMAFGRITSAFDWNKVENVTAKKFCPKCGSKMIDKCTDCNTHIESKDDKFWERVLMDKQCKWNNRPKFC